MIGRAWKRVLSLWEDGATEGEPVYDPVHVAAVFVGCMLALGVLFWVLWGLLVCEGGLFTKILPFLQVVFTSRTLKDFGYEGSPYALGIFEGWIVNLSSLGIGLGLLAGGWRVFRSLPPDRRNP